jgi:hypothetical protein
LDDNLYLSRYEDNLTWIEGLVSISGNLDLFGTKIKSLDNLQSVDGYLDIKGTQIKSFGNLQSVGGNLFLNEYFSEKYTDEEIRSMINVDGDIIRP